MSIREHADAVWRGEKSDNIASFSPGRRPVEDIVDGIGFYSGFGNTIAFQGAGELALFDTGNPMGAAQLHEGIRGWSSDPLVTAIFSHGHIDHVSGMQPFDAEGHGTEVIAHEAIVDRFERYVLTNGYNAVINQRQFQAPGLTWPTEYRQPDLSYRDELTVKRAGWTFEMFHAKGETDDATVAYVPEARVLLPGDMFIWVTPNCGNPQKVQRYPREWALALRRMATLGAEIMLPSHGAPIFGADRVEQALVETAEWLESMVGQTLDLLNAGERLDTIVQAVRPPSHLGERPYLKALYDEPEFVVRNLWRQYGGWYDGNPARLKPAPDAVLAARLADLAGGAVRLGEAALQALRDGDHRLAGHLAELAVQAAPADRGLHGIRAEVYGTRAASEASLMARGVFTWAASESRRLADS
ncbi:MAG: MBL fold metallo-hydrolase [Thermoactinospora sp.]|nr:MBL fold metallo-hydrolase [Thermoactinospora sp.]